MKRKIVLGVSLFQDASPRSKLFFLIASGPSVPLSIKPYSIFSCLKYRPSTSGIGIDSKRLESHQYNVRYPRFLQPHRKARQKETLPFQKIRAIFFPIVNVMATLDPTSEFNTMNKLNSFLS